MICDTLAAGRVYKGKDWTNSSQKEYWERTKHLAKLNPKIFDLLTEVYDEVAKKGIKELIVIAQDTTKYGIDIYGQSKLAELLKISALLDCKPIILGAGTNVLAPDQGMRGIVICLKDCLLKIEIFVYCLLI